MSAGEGRSGSSRATAREGGAVAPAPGVIARRLLRNTGIALRDALAAPFARRVPREWVVVRLDRGLAELPGSSAWLDAWRPGPRPFTAVLEALERAGGDPRVHGVLIRVGQSPLGWARVSGLVRALGRLREQGKRSVVYAESTGNAGAWLGAAADGFWMTPEGRLDLLGVRVENAFVRGALDHLRIRPDVIHAGRYKTAGEIVERASMSPEAREALEPVVDELYGELVRGLAQGRADSEEQARRWIDEGPYLASEAHELGLVDELVYGDELAERLARLGASDGAPSAPDGEREARLVPDALYLRVSRPHFALEPLREGRVEIAVVGVEGLIRSAERSARPLVALLRRLAKMPTVRAVIVRINSPGGDPLASDLIWRAVCKLGEDKPVVASLGDTAASGGYYVAMAAHEIVAEPTTLTGSIGVVLIGLQFEETLERLGIQFDGVKRGRHAGIYDPYRARSAEERAVLERQVDQLYRAFLEKAAAGRGRSVGEIETVAAGRVWTGTQARDHGLVDHLGGLEMALERARSLAGLPADAGQPVFVAPRATWLQRLRGQEPIAGPAALDLLQGIRLLCPLRIPLR